MATSYTNPCGSGDRRGVVLFSLAFYAGATAGFLDGNTTTNTWFFNTTTGNIVEFWFPSPKIIDEAKWYQQTTAAHGTWKWQGSQDRATWTDVGGTFTLGGVATQTLTSLTGNTTAYIFYRLLQVSGSASSSPYIYEIEFKIDEGGTRSYLNVLGSGNRTSLITSISSGITWGAGSPANLINGSQANEAWWQAGAVAGAWVQFDLGAAIVVQQARWVLDKIQANGDWKLQGSPDASAWTDLSAVVTLGTTVAPCFATSFGGANTTAYRYYRWLGVAGTTSTTSFEVEAEFMVAASVAGGGTAVPGFLLSEDFMAYSYNLWTAITPSDTQDLYRVTDGILVGGAGDVNAVQQNGQAVALKGLPAGAWIPIVCRRVNATGTTATNLIALNQL